MAPDRGSGVQFQLTGWPVYPETERCRRPSHRSRIPVIPSAGPTMRFTFTGVMNAAAQILRFTDASGDHLNLSLPRHSQDTGWTIMQHQLYYELPRT